MNWKFQRFFPSQQFEERLYPARKWVSITIEAPERDEAVSKGFYPLFKYISGQNDRSKSFLSTFPLLQISQDEDERKIIKTCIETGFQNSKSKSK